MQPGSGAALLLAAATLLAGCAAPPIQQDEVPKDLAYRPMVATFTPAEPGEQAAHVRVAWGPRTFAGASDVPGEFPNEVVRVDGATFITYAHRGWVRHADDAASGAVVALQAQALDLRALLASPTFTSEREGGALSGNGFLRVAGQEVLYHVSLTVADGSIVAARVEAPGVREAPFTFAPGGAYAAPLDAPTPARSFDDVARLDGAASDAHGFLIQLVGAYAKNHAGLVPDRITPEELRVELLASGKPWPTNPYTGQGVVAEDGHGGALWTKCDPTSATYRGLGWDVPLTASRWGPTDCR